MGWLGDAIRVARMELHAFARWVWNDHAWRPKPWLRRAAVVLFVVLLPVPVLSLLLFRFVPIPATPEMLLHVVLLQPVHQRWVPFASMPHALVQGVIAAEDQNFCRHNGFDWKSIDEALRSHKRHPRKPLRGASTISQQTARTIFLLPVRSWVRKGAEAYLTVLLEALWPKKRILTAYLNLVDWGHGNYGVEAAAEDYFHRPAQALSAGQSARLAAILPDPDNWRAADPGPYVVSRSSTIAARSDSVVRDRLDTCVR
jgi:monofunctional biosynthetic peptidoglycan transglycosylase